jgi:aspartate carbamoyltransferase catalytic subunit
VKHDPASSKPSSSTKRPSADPGGGGPYQGADGKTPALDLLNGKILGNLLYVSSMRTSLSFDVAMKRLGGSVSNIEHPESFSSELPGSFEDTVRVVGSWWT